jgi:hypothetical protein
MPLNDDTIIGYSGGDKHYPVRVRDVLPPFRKRIETWEKMREAFKDYVLHFGAAHEVDCPEDDTCDCDLKPLNDAVNDALRLADEGEAGGGRNI